MNPGKLALAAEAVPAVPFAIPGATGAFRIQLLNQDAQAGVVTSIIHIPAGGRIPAHRHQAGSEMHFVLEGDLVEAGRELGPGGFLSHAAGQVHGPHESRKGARVLTVQSWQSHHGDYDFEPVEATEATPDDGKSDHGKPDRAGTQPVDQRAQEAARREQAGPGAKGYS